MEVGDFPPEGSSLALFRCVKVSPVDNGDEHGLCVAAGGVDTTKIYLIGNGIKPVAEEKTKMKLHPKNVRFVIRGGPNFVAGKAPIAGVSVQRGTDVVVVVVEPRPFRRSLALCFSLAI